MGKRIDKPKKPVIVSADPDLTPEQNEIYQWLQSVQFRRVSFGGVDEVDVWKKIEELNALYEKALLAERSRCRAPLSGGTPSDAAEQAPGGEHHA